MYLGYVSVNFLGSLCKWKQNVSNVFLSAEPCTAPIAIQALNSICSSNWGEPVLSTTFSCRFGKWSIIYVVWATLKQNSKLSSKKVSVISYRLFLCLIRHQKVVKHTFKSISLSWMCGFVHARASLPAYPSALGLVNGTHHFTGK